ncbi:hypothetical protein INR49_020367 [Caranx melampygus]|nr:hypothetical protein INR49_020367 [Caranx melampygus]
MPAFELLPSGSKGWPAWAVETPGTSSEEMVPSSPSPPPPPGSTNPALCARTSRLVITTE